ncbi:MAG: phospholipase D-like domain-containing protein, partial [Gammaproteobacteria bacterium]|nr:phospholipase D-like domain-containing protein [Gammaproteobacteria bacterium]
MFKNKSYHYPWRQNNRFQVLIDGSNFFSAMLNEIKKAKKQILFEAYLFESGITADQFISALCAAKKRNVEVFILLDEYGTKALLQTDKNKITESGIKLLLYNPVNFLHLGQSLKRNHRKLMVVDNMVAFIGGAGITDDFNPSVRPDYWHDIMLKTEGDIVSDLSDSFYEVWNKQQPLFETTTTKISQPHHSKIKQARIIIAQGTENNEINRTIINHIRASKNRIWLTSPYFISSWKIRRALRYAANKGVDVRLIFPGPHSDHKWITHGIRRYYHRLLH